MPQKVLIVDNARPIHHLVRARLGGEPIEIFDAYGGDEGFRLAVEVQPDLILLDVEMPEPDGFEVCRRLKADPATVGIPVVFLSGASSSAEKILGLELGAVDYVTKPFDPAELRARVRASLRTKYLLDLLSKKAQIDGLTGLWNRSYFQQRLGQELSLARRHNRTLACVLADVDHFKAVNDRFGHPFGDDVLRATAAALVESCRKEDVVCRFGGEEFVILVPDTDAVGAYVVADRAREALSGRPLSHRGAPVPITLSFGVAAVCPAQADPPGLESALLDAADRALYRAKQSGRDRIELAKEVVAA